MILKNSTSNRQARKQSNEDRSLNDRASTHEPLRILIVEDDNDARESLRDILELDSHVVSTAASATQALASVRSAQQIDVIILDRRLPEGLIDPFLPDIRNALPEADVIVVTGYADLEGTISALREGVSLLFRHCKGL